MLRTFIAGVAGSLGLLTNRLSQAHLLTLKLSLGLADDLVDGLVVAKELKLLLCQLQVVLCEANHVIAVQLDGADHAENNATVGKSGLDPRLLGSEATISRQALPRIGVFSRQFV